MTQSGHGRLTIAAVQTIPNPMPARWPHPRSGRWPCRNIVGRPSFNFRVNCMRIFIRAAKYSLAAAVAALAAIFLTGARAAEALQVEGGQIANAAPDASGIRVFKGIPYAAPPVGEVRWKAPHPVQRWNGIRHIAARGPRCVQSSRLGDLDPLNIRMDEDCLYPGDIGEPIVAGQALDPRGQQSEWCRLTTRIRWQSPRR